MVLGYYAFPAILIGLFFQAIMFQHGGLTTLGVNATVMGIPALLAFYLFKLHHLGGALAVSAVSVFFLLINNIPAYISAEAERASIYALTIAHIPLMFIEGVFTAFVVLFLHKVKREML